jgi:5-methylcytosine-specific restriction endonuclease McrA
MRDSAAPRCGTGNPTLKAGQKDDQQRADGASRRVSGYTCTCSAGASVGKDEWLLKQRGRCAHCGLRFTADDVLEVHRSGGNHYNNRLTNLLLLRAHCHDIAHGTRYH